MIPIQKLIPIPSKRSSGQKLLCVRYLVAHDVGNPNSTAMQNVDYYIKTANEIEASAHTFIDEKEIIECIDLGLKAYHVRRAVSDAIDYAIGVELCYFPNNYPRSLAAYSNYVRYLADLCKRFNLNPLKDIKGHFQLDPTRRTDPLNAFKYL